MNNLKYINTYRFLRIFSRFLTYSFLPVMIFKTTQSVPLALLYLVLISFFTIIFNFLLKKTIIKHISIMLILSAFVFTTMQLLLVFNNINIYFYAILVACLTGLDNVLTLSIIDYAYNTCPNSEDPKNVKNAFIIENISNALAVFIGGFILTYSTVLANSILAIIFCFISVIFLLICLYKTKNQNSENTEINTEIKNIETNTNEEKNFDKFSRRECFKMLSLAVISTMIIGIASRLGMSWSLYLKVLNIEYSVIGTLSGIICLGQVIFNIITYKAQIRDKDFLLVIMASIILSLCWASRPFFTDLTSLYIFTIIIGLISPFLFQPVKERYLFTLKKYGRKNSILFMDGLIRQSGCITISTIGIALSFLGTTGLQAMFVIGGFAIITLPIFYKLLQTKK